MGRFKIAFAPLRTMKEGATMNECAAPELGPILRYKQFLFDRIPSLEEAFPDSSGVGSSDDRERRKLREFESHRGILLRAKKTNPVHSVAGHI